MLLVDPADAKKLLAVQAIVEIVVADGRLPWRPPLDDLRQAASGTIRAILEVCFDRSRVHLLI